MQKPEEDANTEISPNNSRPNTSKLQLFRAADVGVDKLARNKSSSQVSLKPSKWQLFHAVKMAVEFAKHKPNDYLTDVSPNEEDSL